MNEEQSPGWFFAHVPDDLNLRILKMLEGTFLLDVAQMILEPASLITAALNNKNLACLY